MRATSTRWQGREGRRAGVIAAVLCCVLAAPGIAVDLSPSSGAFRLNIDTTLSWGARYRVEDRDLAIIGLPEGGTAYSVNGDDGDLNFDTGITSNALKATIDVDLSWERFGVFLRGSGFYDFENEDSDRARSPLTEAALDRVGSRAELLDAFAWWQFNVGPGQGEIRVGQQVLSWGESTFIQGGINAINPVDVSALRVPGAELREALLPVGMVSASVDLSANLSLEAFYQYQWEEVIIDPPGTYFSTNDFAGRGGTHVFIGFGSFADTGEPIGPLEAILGPYDHPFMAAARAPDREPEDEGQFGLALRWFAPGLGETEFGFYFLNYHSRLPTVNGIAGSVQGLLGAQAAAGAVYQFFGVPPGTVAQVDQLAQAAATDAFTATARYFLAYPEDIKLYGVSFNSQLGTSGIALQGELSYRQDAPYLIDDVELLFAALSPLSPGLAATNQAVPGGAAPSEEILGYRLHDSTQLQLTATKIFGPILGADQGLLLFEGAVGHVSGMPSKDVLRYEGPGTYTSGNPIHAGTGGAHAGKLEEPADRFADPTSWGYRLVGRLTFNNAIGAVNLIPTIGWQHDVQGTSPGPGGNFIEGRNALTLGLGATYLNSWEFDLTYARYDGAGRYNLITDRDFVAATAKYSF